MNARAEQLPGGGYHLTVDNMTAHEIMALQAFLMQVEMPETVKVIGLSNAEAEATVNKVHGQLIIACMHRDYRK